MRMLRFPKEIRKIFSALYDIANRGENRGHMHEEKKEHFDLLLTLILMVLYTVGSSYNLNISTNATLP